MATLQILFSPNLNVFWQTAVTSKRLFAADRSETLGLPTRTYMQFSLTQDNLFFDKVFFFQMLLES